MKKSTFAILALAVAVLALVPELAEAKRVFNHNQTDLRG